MSAPQPKLKNLAPVPRPTEPAFSFFENSESPLEIPEALMQKLCSQVTEAVWCAETGGLLIAPRASAGRIQVDRIAPLVIEHQFGPSFRLSPADRESLEQLVVAEHGTLDHAVVGCYRSHSQGESIPWEADQELLDAIARVHPSYETDFRFFALFTPLSRVVMELAVARRQDGAWIEWQDIKLRTQSLSLVADVSQRAAPDPPSKPAKLAVRPEPERTPVPIAVVAPPRPVGPRPRRLALYVGMASVVGGAILGVNVWIAGRRPAPAAEPAPVLRTTSDTVSRPKIEFAANPQGPMWRLNWNRDAVAALHPSGAVLSIRDGENEQQVALSQGDLSTGTVFYTPKTGTLLFSLTILTSGSPPVEEHVRVVEALRAAATPAEPDVRIEGDDHKVRTLRPFRDTSKPAQPFPSNPIPADVAPPPALAAGGTASGVAIPLPMQTPAPPVEAPPAAAPAPRTPVPAAVAPIPQTLQSPVTTRSLAPPKIEYMGPKPIRQMAASLPATVSVSMPQTVQVRVTIDPSGKVVKTTPIGRTPTNFPLIDAALRAARYWVFEPARENGHPVTSEMVLKFEFGRK